MNIVKGKSKKTAEVVYKVELLSRKYVIAERSFLGKLVKLVSFFKDRKDTIETIMSCVAFTALMATCFMILFILAGLY